MNDDTMPEVVSERLATLRVEHPLVELVRRGGGGSGDHGGS